MYTEGDEVRINATGEFGYIDRVVYTDETAEEVDHYDVIVEDTVYSLTEDELS